MAPSENATGDPQGSSWPSVQKNEPCPIYLQAAKVAIHVRPRSPGRSPVKYLPIDTSWGAQLDVSAPKDVDSRPVLHLEVKQQRLGDPSRPGSGSKRAVVDVVQVPSRGPIPAAPPANAAATAAVSITVQPLASPAQATVTQMGNRPAPIATLAEPGKQPSTQRHVLAGRQPATATASMGPVGGSTQAPSSGPGHGFQPNIAANAPNGNTTNPLTHTGSTVAAAVTAPVAGLSPADQRSATVSRVAKGGGAALLAEILGTHIAQTTGPSSPQLVPANAPDSRNPGDRFFRGPHHLPSLGQTSDLSSRQPPSGSGAGLLGERSAAAAAAAAIATVAWSWEEGQTLAMAAAAGAVTGSAGIRDPEEEARRARRRHRKRVARIVVDHWKQFARQRLQDVAAKRHLRRRLLTAAWVAWQAETASARARMRLAAVYDMKRSYLRLGRCVQAWSAAAKRLTQLRNLQERVTVDRLLRRSRACLRAWRGRCYHSAEKQRRRLQAWFYYCFSTLTRALRKWHGWAERRRVKARRVAWAEAQHGAALGRKALLAWRRAVTVRHWKAAAAQRAVGFRRRNAARGALRRWRDAAGWCRTTRDAAIAALAATAAGMFSQRAAAAFMEWQAYAAERRRRRQRERYGNAYMRRWRQLVVLWGWRQRVVRSRHLKMCVRVMQRVGRRVRLHLSWSRWWLALEVLQGQRNTELRAVVLVRACWVTWRAMVEHWAVKRELLRIATHRVGLVVAAAVLAAWRVRVVYWQAKAVAWGRAVAWQRRGALTRLLRSWSCEAARRAAKAVAVYVAEGHWRRKALGSVVRAWRRYAWRQIMKRVVSEHRPHRLLRGALGGWLSHTRYKARKELDRRRAVRHRYLTLLHSGLHAFRAAVERRHAKQRDWADLARLHSLHVARGVLHVWRYGFLPVATAKRAAGQWADEQRRTSLLRRALAGWRVEAARLAAKCAREREAAGFAALQLLRRVVVAWSTAPRLQETRRVAKAVRLAELVSELAANTTRRLLAAWRQVAEDLVMKRFQDTRARAAWRHRTLRRSMTAWALYLAHRRTATRQTALARTAYRHRMWRAVLEALARYAATRRAKRRTAAVAWEHQRRVLLRRGIAALIWYARYRVVKVREYIAARALYVRRLQREGVAAWLQVGLELRQQRIEMLVAQQARNLAQQLARVEPFARRWLNLVRHRRRQRQQQLRSWIFPLETGFTYPSSRPMVRAAAMGVAAVPAAASGPAAAASRGPWSLSAWPTTRTSSYPVSATAAAAAAGAAAAAADVRPVDAGVSVIGFGGNGGRLRRVAATAIAAGMPTRGWPAVATPTAAFTTTTSTTGAAGGAERTGAAVWSASHAAAIAAEVVPGSYSGGDLRMLPPFSRHARGGEGLAAAAAASFLWPPPRTPSGVIESAAAAATAVAPTAVPATISTPAAHLTSPTFGGSAQWPSSSSPCRNAVHSQGAPGPAGAAGPAGDGGFNVNVPMTAAASRPRVPTRPQPRCPDFLLLPRRPATVACFRGGAGAGAGGGQADEASVRGLYDRPASLGATGGGVPNLPTANANTETSVSPGTARLVSCAAAAISCTNGSATTAGAADANGAGRMDITCVEADDTQGALRQLADPSTVATAPAAAVGTAAAVAHELIGSCRRGNVAAGGGFGDGRRGGRGGGGAGGGAGDGFGSVFWPIPRQPAPPPLFVPNVPSASVGMCEAATALPARRDVGLPDGHDGRRGGGGGGGGGGFPIGPSGRSGGDGWHSAAVPPSSAASIGITIHRPGPHPPDVLRLPTRGEGVWAEVEEEEEEDAAGQGMFSNPAVDQSELRELESVLLHCKGLKVLLQQLEAADTAGGRPAVEEGLHDAATVAAAATAAAVRQQQAAQVRAALAELRPVVEDAAARLSQIRWMAAAGMG